MCGEQPFGGHSGGLCQGSPPRVRGTVGALRALWPLDGITPACAGNRMSDGRTSFTREDHPRVCGEQLMGLPSMSIRIGSPPRVRGTVASVIAMAGDERITPACAGNSRFGNLSATIKKDHPRVCGEQEYRPLSLMMVMGSPPRVRGTAIACSASSVSRRITPACAGNSDAKQSWFQKI